MSIDTRLLAPIPFDAGDVAGWDDSASDWFVSVHESDEEMVNVADVDRQILQKPAYHPSGYQILTRRTVAEMLSHAQAMLPDGLQLVIFDGWRSYKTQDDLYQAELAARRDDVVDDDKLHEIVRRYVSMPVGDGSPTPTPHSTGGAVDVALAGHGSLLNFGSDFDQMDETSSLAYLERTGARTEARDHRRLLYNVMALAGFEAYQHEWWHFNYGNQMAAVARWHRTGQKQAAIYGAVKRAL